MAGSAAEFGLSAVTLDDIRGSAQRALQHSLGLLTAVAIVALVMSMIAVVNTLMANIRQGSRELSMLRAVGLDRGGARRLVLTEAVLLAASGAILGVVTLAALWWPACSARCRRRVSRRASPSRSSPPSWSTVVAGSVIASIGPAIGVARSSIVAAIRQD